MIKIFKEHASKTCILDDFGFYEARQKTIQEKKAKQQQFKKQVAYWKLAPFFSLRVVFVHCHDLEYFTMHAGLGRKAY